MDLRGDELAEHIVVVVDRAHHHVYLRRPVGHVPALGALHELIPLHEIPPERVEILAGIAVEPALEVEHHLAPPGEDELFEAQRPRDRGRDPRGVLVRNSERRLHPVRILREASEEHGGGLREAARRIAPQEEGKAAVDVLVVRSVAELVEDRLHPVAVVLHVGENAYVAGAVDVGAEGVRVLAGTLVEVARREDILDRHADAGVERLRDLDGVLARVVPVEIQLAHLRQLLKIGIVIVPRPQILDHHAVGLREIAVELRFQREKRLARHLVELGEDADELVLVLLAERERHRVVIIEARRPRGLVAELHERDEIVADERTHVLARLPRGAPFRAAALLAEDAVHLVRVDRVGADDGHVHREPVLGRAREAEYALEKERIGLVAEVAQVQDVGRAPKLRIGELPGFFRPLHEREVRGIGVELFEPQLRLGVARVVRFLARVRRSPVGEIGLLLHRREFRDVRRDEILELHLNAFRARQERNEPEHQDDAGATDDGLHCPSLHPCRIRRSSRQPLKPTSLPRPRAGGA